jgi:hypothetical protein
VVLIERLSAMSYDRRTEQQKSPSLEELGLPYTVIPVNIRAGMQFKPGFLDEEARKNMFGERAKEMAGRK